MYIAIAVVFVLGYAFIALEHNLHIDKAASAVLTGVICWTLLAFAPELLQHAAELMPAADGAAVESAVAGHELTHAIAEHVADIAQILFFLLAAMTIVELIDAHGGFEIITSRITTTNRVKLIWILGVVTFFLSAALDNLTTAIVMATLLRKLVDDKHDLWYFAGIVVIAANAGGAWSPIGDVTTIMLWIGGQVTASHIVVELLLPSLVCLTVPLALASMFKRGVVTRPAVVLDSNHHHVDVGRGDRNLIFALGIGGLLFVPIFKTVTHLPPFMGMLLSLGALWLITERLHSKKDPEYRNQLSVASVLRRVDTPSVLFFLGILLAVAALQTAGHLAVLADALRQNLSSIYVVNGLIGLCSSIVDNVPLVAGTMGMYSLDVYPVDDLFWVLLAYCAGTGGSALIIGSAAGVAIMGILKIDFMWYLKHISLLALAGYLSGLAVIWLIG